MNHRHTLLAIAVLGGVIGAGAAGSGRLDQPALRAQPQHSTVGTAVAADRAAASLNTLACGPGEYMIGAAIQPDEYMIG